MKIITSNKHRIIASISITLLIVFPLIILDGVSSHQGNIGQVAQYKADQETANNHHIKSILDNLPDKGGSEYGNMLNNDKKNIIPDKPPILYPLIHHIASVFKNFVTDALYIPFILAVYIYSLLYCVNVYMCEQHIGWKRLSILIASIAAVIAIMIAVYLDQEITYEVTLTVVLLAIFTWHMVLTFMLVCRRLYYWVNEGFK